MTKRDTLSSEEACGGATPEELRALNQQLRDEMADRETVYRVLREQGRTLEAFFQNTMTCLVFLDTQFNFIIVNQRYADACAREPSSFVGLNHFALYPSEELEGQFRRVVESKGRFQAFARPFTFPDHPEWGETWWDLSLTPILDERGDIDFLIFALDDVTPRKRAELELERAHAELEEHVRERTLQLSKANEALQAEIEERRRAESELKVAVRELESFCYAVSHDLRAPLRAIDGFTSLLEEHAACRLDEKGAEMLSRIRAAAGHLGSLMDGLLELSRLSRGEMHHVSVDLSALARQVVDELRAAAPEREVAFEIEDGLTAHGDPRLLYVAMKNLLENAFKFTSQRQGATVGFGRTPRAAGSHSEGAYFVRDDGAGFNPAYTSRLFAPFSRLHRVDDFPGTGLGLATVQRVIHRHGGEVWAEGAVGQGATFYFTLR